MNGDGKIFDSYLKSLQPKGQKKHVAVSTAEQIARFNNLQKRQK